MPRILLLGSRFDPAKDMVYNAINPLFEIHTVILEAPVSKSSMIKRRIKKLGIIKVFGQLCFQVLVVKCLNLLSRKYKKQLMASLGLDTTPLPEQKARLVETVNDDECIRIIREVKPDLVLVKGTRIISAKVLEAAGVPFVNMHVGITPQYRGVHGAYWALANKDAAHAGTTIHFVDKGIDTGNIIAQQIIDIGPKDNFVTYPLKQIAAGIDLLRLSLPKLLQGEKLTHPSLSDGPSRLWSHPTIWYYLKKRISSHVK